MIGLISKGTTAGDDDGPLASWSDAGGRGS